MAFYTFSFIKASGKKSSEINSTLALDLKTGEELVVKKYCMKIIEKIKRHSAFKIMELLRN